MKKVKNQEAKDIKPKVTGIGGIFFKSDNPAKTREWYASNLGLATTEFGSSFEFRNANTPDEINYLQWSPFKKDTDYMSPSKKEFMVNYRVQNIEGLVNQLIQNKVTILDEIKHTITVNSYILWITKGIKLNFGNPLTMFLQIWAVLPQSSNKSYYQFMRLEITSIVSIPFQNAFLLTTSSIPAAHISSDSDNTTSDNPEISL